MTLLFYIITVPWIFMIHVRVVWPYFYITPHDQVCDFINVFTTISIQTCMVCSRSRLRL